MMNPEPIEYTPRVIRAFRAIGITRNFKLLTWHPTACLNDAFADQIIEFIEMEEHIQDAPFDRYTDLSGLTHIKLKIAHIFEIARRRRQVKQPVKSAFFAEHPVSFAASPRCMKG